MRRSRQTLPLSRATLRRALACAALALSSSLVAEAQSAATTATQAPAISKSPRFSIGGVAEVPIGNARDAHSTGLGVVASLHVPWPTQWLGLRVDGHVTRFPENASGLPAIPVDNDGDGVPNAIAGAQTRTIWGASVSADVTLLRGAARRAFFVLGTGVYRPTGQGVFRATSYANWQTGIGYEQRLDGGRRVGVEVGIRFIEGILPTYFVGRPMMGTSIQATQTFVSVPLTVRVGL